MQELARSTLRPTDAPRHLRLKNIVIAIDGTSASGKSTNAKLVAKALGFVYVDTGAMYRTLAWHCLRQKFDVEDERAVAAACRKWKTSLECLDSQVHLKVDGYYPAQEIRTAEVSAAVPHVAAVRLAHPVWQPGYGGSRHWDKCFSRNRF